MHNAGNGFDLTETRPIQSIHAQAQFYRHSRTGAKMIHIQRDDEERVFAVAFRTPPPDHSGVTHIIEHSVLCGSERFPSKEPFVELLKGSLKTFLNALTYADRTLYPVASCNLQDLLNLADVYLDAVFQPNLHRNPDILMQEGWHYELDGDNGELTIQGVVYNEMKGVFSSPEGLHYRYIATGLLPDTPYKWISGGDPDFIPSLTQQTLSSYHRQYYHPSNALFYYYGKDGLPEILELLGERHLSRFSSGRSEPAPSLQEPFKEPKTLELDYAFSDSDDPKGKAYLSLNWVVGDAGDALDVLGLEVLAHILTGSPAAPLRRALLEAGLGRDASGSLQTSYRQPIYTLFVKHTDPERRQELERIANEVLDKLAKDGIDAALWQAALNTTEFHIREAEQAGFPRGIVYLLSVIESWMYGGDPVALLDFEPLLDKLRKLAPQGYFERLIKERLLVNPHRLTVIQTPQKGLEAQRSRELKQKLARIKADFTPEQLAQIAESARSLKVRQGTPDREEDLLKIPSLNLSDLKREAADYPIEVDDDTGVKILSHPLDTDGIVYLKLYFDCGKVPQVRLPEIGLLSRMLGKIGTESFTYQELVNQLELDTGGFGCHVQSLPSASSETTFKPLMVITLKALRHKTDALFRLAEEILARSNFADLRRIGEVFRETLTRQQVALHNAPHQFAIIRSRARVSPAEWFTEYTSGLTFLVHLNIMKESLQEDAGKIGALMADLTNRVVGLGSLTVSITADAADLPKLQKSAHTLADWINVGDRYGLSPMQKWEIATALPYREACAIPSRVQHMALCGDFRRAGHEFSGALSVAENLLNYNYLWNRVRVQGGAYGAFAGLRQSGLTLMGSFRDPQLLKTIEAFNESPAFLRNLEINPRDLSRAVIGTISNYDHPLPPSAKGDKAAMRHLSGMTYQMLQQERDEILSVDAAKLRQTAEVFQAGIEPAALTVFGDEQLLRREAQRFDSVSNPVTGETIYTKGEA